MSGSDVVDGSYWVKYRGREKAEDYLHHIFRGESVTRHRGQMLQCMNLDKHFRNEIFEGIFHFFWKRYPCARRKGVTIPLDNCDLECIPCPSKMIRRRTFISENKAWDIDTLSRLLYPLCFLNCHSVAQCVNCMYIHGKPLCELPEFT